MSGIPFPPKPWVDGQTFEYEQDGTTITGKYDASANAWTFTRSFPGASTGQITTATVLAMNERPPALAVSPFSDAYQGTETQQDINWFLFDDIENTVRYSNDQPPADNFVNRFWWDTNTEVLYVWDGVQWQLSSPNAASQNVTRGVVIDASGGSVNETGNLVIRNDPDTPNSGRFYIEDDEGVAQCSIFSSGAIETKNSISLTGPNTYKSIRAYGGSPPYLRFLVGPNTDNLSEPLSLEPNAVRVKEFFTSDKSAYFNDNVTVAGELLSTNNITASGNVECQELRVNDELDVFEDATMHGGFLVDGNATFDGNVVFNSDVRATNQLRIQSNETNVAGLQIQGINNTTNNALAKQPSMLEFVTGSSTPGKYTGIIVDGNSGFPVWTFGMGGPGNPITSFEERSINPDGIKTWKIYPTYTSSTDGATPATLDWVRDNANGLPTNWTTYNSFNPFNGNVALNGTSWLIRAAYNDTTAIMVLNLDNSGVNLTSGMEIGFPPADLMPSVTTSIHLWDVTGNTFGYAVIEPATGQMRIRSVVGPGTTKLQGQLIYSKRSIT